MFLAILNAAFIYGLIWMFERKRRELHKFDFDMIAVVPPFVYFGLTLIVLVFGLGIWGAWVAAIVFMIVLFWMLWRNAKLSLARASAYVVAVRYSGPYHAPKTPSTQIYPAVYRRRIDGCTARLWIGKQFPKSCGEQRHPQALSPEFNARLASRFPQGFAEKALVTELAADGFKPAGSCETDPSIKFLVFDSKGRGAPNVSATVYWQADLSGRIVWTKGFVAYTFL
jgi:hypothetical protein